MRSTLLQLPFVILLALGVATGAHAQAKKSSDRVELPVWNKASGEIEGVLVLEPADVARWKRLARFGSNHLNSTFGLNEGDSLGMLCDRKQGLGSSLDSLKAHCVLAVLPHNPRRSGASAVFGRNGTSLGVGAGNTRGTIPAWRAPAFGGNGRIDANDVTVFSTKALPREGFVSIAGTVAKARIQAPTEIPGFTDRWTGRQLSVAGGIGSFGVSVIGEVIDTPGPDKWEGLSLGLSWRTPWSGQLSVGADNLLTRGKNPFAPATSEDEGAAPYVRYEQDL